jgi:hypothetical protein
MSDSPDDDDMATWQTYFEGTIPTDAVTIRAVETTQTQYVHQANEEYLEWRRQAVAHSSLRGNGLTQRPMFGGAVLIGLVVLFVGASIVSVAMHSSDPIPITPAVAQAPAAKPEPPPRERHWQRWYGPNLVDCTVNANGAYYILMPTVEQMQDGVQPTVNMSPSDDSWRMACGDGP